jgi:predicted transcriptional regulator of viral defense system
MTSLPQNTNTQNALLRRFYQHGGVLTTHEVSAWGIPSMTLTRLIEQGLIERTQRGVYRLVDTGAFTKASAEADELLDIQLRFPFARPFLSSALHLHELTTTRPSALQLAIPAHRHALPVQFPAIEVFFVTPQYYDSDLFSFPVGQRNLITYTAEKTICDLLRYSSKFGRELYLEGLKKYLRHHSSHRLIETAKRNRVWKKLSPDLEVLLHDQDR